MSAESTRSSESGVASLTQSNIINVVGDMEHFLDILLSHVNEENCTHSVMDLLKEYFDKKNEITIVKIARDNHTPNQDGQLQETTIPKVITKEQLSN